ncbi:hypothetical protein ETC05_14355 [Geobacillus sp. BMUD]|nr:hypothetical protein [Geobacillus sp. BMUD]
MPFEFLELKCGQKYFLTERRMCGPKGKAAPFAGRLSTCFADFASCELSLIHLHRKLLFPFSPKQVRHEKPNIVYHIGMYMRRATRKNKDGTTVAYLQLAHNE